MFTKIATWSLAPSVPFWVSAAITIMFAPLNEITERTL